MSINIYNSMLKWISGYEGLVKLGTENLNIALIISWKNC